LESYSDLKLFLPGFFKTIIDFFSKINETHVLTITVGISTFIFLRIMKKFYHRIPSPLLAVIIGIIVTIIFGFDKLGLAVVGHVPSGFPMPYIPQIDPGKIETLITGSLGIVLISYASGMLTDKSFASKNGYKIDANKDFIALGVANIFSGLSQGFVISGADSRTAVNDSSGGKTQLVSVFAAVSIAVVVLFFTQYFEFLPVTILSAIIISATLGMFNIEYLKKLYKVSRNEFILAMFTALSVITIGVLKAVILAIGITLIRLLAKSSKPHDEILGLVEGTNRYHDIKEYSESKEIPGILIYRFESSLLFYNADYFKSRIDEEISKRKANIKFLILDASSINKIDITASDTIDGLIDELSKEGIEFSITKIQREEHSILNKSGVLKKIGNENIFDSVHLAVDSCLKKEKAVSV
jgi:MFS superfamily sulfate permease-like transporter